MDDKANDSSNEDQMNNVIDVKPPDKNNESTKPESDNPTADNNESKQQPAQSTPLAKKKASPALVIVFAILVAAVLAILTVLAFTQESDKTNNEQPATSTAVEEESVDANDVDEITSDIDEAVNQADSNPDFPDNELSDENLGL